MRRGRNVCAVIGRNMLGRDNRRAVGGRNGGDGSCNSIGDGDGCRRGDGGRERMQRRVDLFGYGVERGGINRRFVMRRKRSGGGGSRAGERGGGGGEVFKAGVHLDFFLKEDGEDGVKFVFDPLERGGRIVSP